MNNLEKYKKDLSELIRNGEELLTVMHFECFSDNEKKRLREKVPTIDQLPNFSNSFQAWYSESLAVIRLLLPDRLGDFVKLYEKPSGRKLIGNDNYVIEDYLQGLTLSRGSQIIVNLSAAISRFSQQLNILKSCQKRFESSLFDIKQLLQADLFDSEIEAAKQLNKKGYKRAAGAVAGVVLEHHLLQICNNHKITILKKNSSINDYNELLKSNGVIEVPKWRYIQLLGDLRNLCDHKKDREPTKEEIEKLLKGVNEIMKTVF